MKKHPKNTNGYVLVSSLHISIAPPSSIHLSSSAPFCSSTGGFAKGAKDPPLGDIYSRRLEEKCVLLHKSQTKHKIKGKQRNNVKKQGILTM